MRNQHLTRRLLAAALLGSLAAGSSTWADACSCPGDINISGTVDGADLGALLSTWGTSGPAADLDGNGVVNGADLGILLANWGACPALANDNCSSAQSITTGSYPFCTTFATTDGPSFDLGFCGPFATDIGKDVWFRYTAVSTGQLTVSTCSTATFDTVIAVYGSTIPGTSPCPTGGIGLATSIACSDDATGCSLQSKVTFNVNAGSIYLIRVGGFGSSSGSGTLNVTLTQPGESCANPRLANNVPAFQTITGNTSDNPYSNFPTTCFGGTNPGPAEWIKWTSSCQGVVTVSTCNPGTNFDTVLTVLRYEFDGNCWSTFVACNDDSTQQGCMIGGFNRKSWLQVQVTPGEVLHFVVSGWGGGSGAYELTIDRNCN